MADKAVYGSLGEIVRADHTTLLMWDVQEALVNNIFNKADFVRNLAGLCDSARKEGIPLVYTKITPLPARFESSFRQHMMMKRFKVDSVGKLPPFLQPGTPGAQIYGELKPTEDDIVLNKHTASVFIGTHFEYLLRNAGITTILFAGISTEFGISSSARDAANRGFYPVIVEDCVSSTNQELHEASLKVLQNLCIVAQSADIISQWQ